MKFLAPVVFAACILFSTGSFAATMSNPPPGAIILFDGDDMAQWVGSSGTAAEWNVTNGVLSIVPGSGSIRTWQTFEDFQLHLEFRFPSTSPPGTPEGNLANSGVFLQDQFEIQIIESYNRALSGLNDGAAIWSLRDANTNASLPGGQWEAFDITFRAARWTNGAKVENARVTVFWNGVLVHDEAEISRPTAGGAPPEQPAPGPIMLQELVGTVQYRNIWVLPLTQPRAPGPESVTFISARSNWRYLDDGSDQGFDWLDDDFNDSGWSSGVAQLGYGDNDEATLIRSNRLDGTRIQTTYFRKSFVVSNAWAITNLVVGLLRDDGAIVHLNGEVIFRSNMTNGAVTYTNWALATVNVPEESRFYTTNVNPGLLVNGTNWVAVEVHQQSAASSDMSFDLWLTALAWAPPAITYSHGGDAVALSWPAAPGGFALESATNLWPGAVWNVPSNTVLLTNGFFRTVVAPEEPARFYRLRR